LKTPAMFAPFVIASIAPPHMPSTRGTRSQGL
jgi:hypothetical protein